MESLERLASASRGLGSRFSAAFVECRVERDDPRIDLLVCARADDRPPAEPLEAVAGDAKEGSSAAGFAAAVFREWDSPATVLHGVAPLLWLEYDDAGSKGGLGTPSVCVCVERDYLRRRPFAEARPGDWRQVTQAVLEMPECPPESRLSLPLLQACFDELPVDGRPIHLSVMCGRNPPLAKLYARIPTAEVVPWLQRIGWRGDDAVVLRFLDDAPLPEPFSYVDLALTSDAPLPQVGLAFPTPLRGLGFDAEIFTFAASISSPDAAVPRLREQLLDWTRRSPPLATHGDGWPLAVHRWVDQKVVFRSGERPQLKVYLGLKPHPILFGAARARRSRDA